MKPFKERVWLEDVTLEQGIESVAALMGWYHTIDFGGGTVTPGLFDHKPYLHHYGFPEDLSGYRVLDIGTANGFFAFEFEKRGADEVVAVDVHGPEIFNFTSKALGSDVKYFVSSIHDLTPERLGGTFDMVFCGDLLLHLDDIVGAMRTIRALTGQFAIISSGYAPGLDESVPLVYSHLTNVVTTALAGPSRGTKHEYPLTWIGNRAFYKRLFEYVGFRDTRVVSTHTFRPSSGHNTDMESEMAHIVVRGEVS